MSLYRWSMCLCLFSAVVGIASAAEPQRPNPGSLGELSQSLESLAATVRPAVVQIISTGYGRISGAGQGSASMPARQRSTGSGVILSSDGYIVTNNHVIDGARKVEVRLSAFDHGITQDSVLRAKLVGIDRQSDLAVIKIERINLPTLKLGESNGVHEGQLVMAFGNPFGLQGSVSMGVVSSTARQVRENDPIGYVQTDAPINPGNSGGPLVDTDGHIVGINTFILSQSGGSEGIGFAIPSDIVQSVYDQIRKDGHVHRGQIGITAMNITPEMTKVLRLPHDYGVIMADIIPDGPADKAGLKQGDVIVTLNGKSIIQARELQNAIYSQALDNQVAMTVNRDGQELSFNVPVIERHDDPQRFADMVDREKNQISRLGVFGIEVDDKLKEMLPELRRGYGVLVAGETNDTPYSGESLLVGDAIYEVNRVPAVSVRAVSATLDTLKPGDPAVLLIERDGGLMYLTIELE